MDLSSRWDRCAGLFFLLLAVVAMPGCQGLFGGASSQSGTVSAANANLDFGTAVVGSSLELTDTINNQTSAAVTIASALSSDPSFRVNAPAMPLTLAAGQSATLTIAFTPRNTGKPKGTIAITSNAVGAGEIDVVVSGSAIAAGKLTVNPPSLAFGSIRVGQSQMLSATLTNPGGTDVTVSQDSVSSGAFVVGGLTLPTTLAAGQSVPFDITFTPKAAGNVSGNITVTGNSSLTMKAVKSSATSQSEPTSVVVSVSGAGMSAGQLGASPGSIGFGNVTVGSSQNQNVTLTNGTGGDVTITQASATGTGFSVSGLSLPVTLNAGQSTALIAKFAPASAGVVSGTLAISSNAPNTTLNVPFTGTGVNGGSLASNPTSVAFGSVTAGSSQNQTITLTNGTTGSVTITQASATGTGFSVSGLSLPVTLNVGQSTTLTARFAPTSAGAISGNLGIISNAPNPNLSVALSGTGVNAGSLAANPSSIAFGSVTTGSSQNQTITLTNGGGTSVTINQASATGTGFSLSGVAVPLTLDAGQSTTLMATFSPGAAGAATGNIAIVSTAPNPNLNVALTGTGTTPGSLSATSTSIPFGSVQVGSTQSQSETLRNAGGSTLHILTAQVSGAGFAVSGLAVPATLSAGQSLTFNVTFTPTSGGAVTGSLALTADGSVPNVSVAMSGNGTTPGQLTATPTTVNFGNVTVGVTQNQAGTLTAAGAGVTISGSSSSNPEFTLSGISLPITLSAGQSVPFNYSFTPQASGAASGTITFASNATNVPVTAALSGTGASAPQHSVSLSWTASTSTVAGYNVYRGTQAGGPYAVLNGTPEVSTSYADSSVQAGQTYYYVVTAIDGSGNESVNSNQAQAVVPTP